MFRDPVSNVRYTKSLFYEQNHDPVVAIYTLKDKDHKSYISLYRRYMDMRDPLEINFANTYFDGWEHWEMVCNTTWFKPYIERWRKELSLLMRAEALGRVQAIARDESHRGSFAANKLLLEGGWMDKDEKKVVGRPSKEAIREAADALFSNEKSMKDDLARLIQ